MRAISGDGNKWSSGYSNMDSCTGRLVEREEIAQSGTSDPASGMLNCTSYPNPFNPSTTVDYSIPTSGHVHLLVHDILGREVVRLVDDDVEAGLHQSVWSGCNASGQIVPSGIYYLRLQSFTASGSLHRASVQKLVLMK